MKNHLSESKHYIIVVLITTLILSFDSLAQESSSHTDNSLSNMNRIEKSYLLEKGKLFFIDADSKREIHIGSTVEAIYEYNNELYVALGPRGVAILSTTGETAGTVTKIIPISHGTVTGLVEIENALWMKVNSTTAVKLSQEGDSSGAPYTLIAQENTLPTESMTVDAMDKNKASSTKTASNLITANIVKIYPGKVILDKGAKDGIFAGDRFKVYRRGYFSPLKGDKFSGEQVVAVLIVEAVNENGSIANIWRGDRLLLSDKIRKAQTAKDASLIYPRKFDGVGEIATTLRPIINIGEKGFGALCDLTIAYYAQHFFLDFRIQPLGFGWTNGSKIITNSMTLSGGYNSRPFAVGLGVGLTSVNGNLAQMMDYYFYEYEDTMNEEAETLRRQSTQHAFSLAQRVRLGAQDGLNITINNTLLYYNAKSNSDTPPGFIYGGTTARITWPLALRTDMFIEGGGGVMGFGFGALGVFTWLRGNGDAGSIGLSVSAGGAAIWIDKEHYNGSWIETEEVFIAGPMFSIGMNYRFRAME